MRFLIKLTVTSGIAALLGGVAVGGATASEEKGTPEFEAQDSKRVHLTHQMDGGLTLSSTEGAHEGIPSNGSALPRYSESGPNLGFEVKRNNFSTNTLHAYFQAKKADRTVGTVKVSMSLNVWNETWTKAEFIDLNGNVNTSCVGVSKEAEHSYSIVNKDGLCWPR
ncbi:hypothetical protein [Streptomyces cyaneofuscatus]|uniref:hypothetical protein n=1 Tax=Streptomyces cyaneofuscatus TaxID=66883 RepID=UPI0036589F51